MNQHVAPPNIPPVTVPPANGRPSSDFYPTPHGATKALLQHERFPGAIWEPAAGHGDICEVLRSEGFTEIFTSDKHNHLGGPIHDAYGDFTGMDRGDRRVDHIVTNPPYGVAEKFIRHALTQADSKVAMLLRLAFLESITRRPFFDDNPPARVWVFRKRLSLYPYGHSQLGKGGGKTAMAWFVWDRSHRGRPQIDWL